MAETPKDPRAHFISLAWAIGVSSMVIVFLGANSGANSYWPVAVAVVALAAMGLGIAYFLSKSP